MTGEEMEPDVDPSMLPLQGVRLSPSHHPATTATTASPTSISFSQARRPGSARPAPRRPASSSQKGDASRLPAAARPATRVASHVRPPRTSSVPIDQSEAAPSKLALATQRLRGPPPANSSRTPPLLPLSERKQGQNMLVSRPGQNSEPERLDITPDGGSGGREGRRFAVSNVGNNGRIYLRCVVWRKWALRVKARRTKCNWEVECRESASGSELLTETL